MELNQVLEIKRVIKDKKLNDILSFPEGKTANKGMIGQLLETQVFNKRLDNKKKQI